MDEYLATKRFEELIQKESVTGSINDEMELLYKYLIVTSLQRIGDHLSSIETAISSIYIEEL